MPKEVQINDLPKNALSQLKGSDNPKYKNYKWNDSKWSRHRFLCFDGEGCNINDRHQYVYLACYNGKRFFSIVNKQGLSTVQCFRFLLNCSGTDKYAISVIYGGAYDANMILGDCPRYILIGLQEGLAMKWGDYKIKFASRKFLYIEHMPTGKNIQLWDVIGFFQTSFINSIDKWLSIDDEVINAGKRDRAIFTVDMLPGVIVYCKKELEYFESMMQRLWKALCDVDITLNRWDGAGAIAAALYKKFGVIKESVKGSEEDNQRYYTMARGAYAGGRFELIKPGDYQHKVFNYDINSAYPFAMIKLPSFRRMIYCSKSPCVYGEFDLLKVHFEADDRAYSCDIYPYFHRSRLHNVIYPPFTTGWHWAPEYFAAEQIYPGCSTVIAHLHWVDGDSLDPFRFLQEMYDKRKILKANGDRAELAYKLGINSAYGKCVQQKGWREGQPIPKTHQLYWGGWITAKTRSMIFLAMMQKPDKIIGVETDGIYSMEPLDLDIGNNLGQWECTVYDNFTYVSNGMYFADKYGQAPIVKYRGLDPETLTRDMVYEAWENGKDSVIAKSTRFRTIGTSLMGERFIDWRQWRTEDKDVIICSQRGVKREHFVEIFDKCVCDNVWGRGINHTTIAVHVDKTQGIESYPYNVLWVDQEDKENYYELTEEDWEREILGH